MELFRLGEADETPVQGVAGEVAIVPRELKRGCQSLARRDSPRGMTQGFIWREDGIRGKLRCWRENRGYFCWCGIWRE